MKGWWLQFRKQPWDRRMLWPAAVLAAIPILFSLVKPSAPPDTGVEPSVSVDTHIPRGYVLIPIDVQNYEALDSVLGRFGIVDLYQAGENAAKGKLIARNVRLLRAPNNPSHFAVLVPELEASEVLRFGGQFTVIIKRPGQAGTEFVKQAGKGKRSITYEGG